MNTKSKKEKQRMEQIRINRLASIIEGLSNLGPEGERECSITLLNELLDSMMHTDKVYFSNPNRRITNNVFLAEESIYICKWKNTIFVPEKLVAEIANRDYMEITDLVEILQNTRYRGYRILDKNFYKQLHVSTPISDELVDCLVIRYPILKRIAIDLMFE